MSSWANRLNAALFRLPAACGHILWREQLAQREARAAHRRQHADGALAVYTSTVWHTGWRTTCSVRDAISRPRVDRALGTGWDRGAGRVDVRPGGGSSHVTASTGQQRYDLGGSHRRAANWLGGGDVAVLATHLPFFLLRMARHAVLGAITGLAMSAGLFYGACIVGPYETVRRARVLVDLDAPRLPATAAPDGEPRRP